MLQKNEDWSINWYNSIIDLSAKERELKKNSVLIPVNENRKKRLVWNSQRKYLRKYKT